MRFVAYSKYDGQPLPARNPQELEVLLQQGHHAKPLEATDAEPSGADGTATEADHDNEWVRDKGGYEGVAGDGAGVPVPPATRKRN